MAVTCHPSPPFQCEPDWACPLTLEKSFSDWCPRWVAQGRSPFHSYQNVLLVQIQAQTPSIPSSSHKCWKPRPFRAKHSFPLTSRHLVSMRPPLFFVFFLFWKMQKVNGLTTGKSNFSPATDENPFSFLLELWPSHNGRNERFHAEPFFSPTLRLVKLRSASFSFEGAEGRYVPPLGILIPLCSTPNAPNRP